MISTDITRRLLALFVALLLGISTAGRVAAQEQRSATEKAFNEARQLYDDGKLTEALDALQQFENQYKFSAVMPQVIYLQGQCWVGLQKYPRAVSTFDRLVKEYPFSALIPNAILKQAESYRELGNYAKSVDLYHQFETNYPKHEMLPQALLGEAWTLFNQNDLKTFKEVIQKVRTRFADNPAASVDALFLTGQIMMMEKDYAGACEVYREVAKHRDNPRASESLFRIAACYQLLGHHENATTAYREFLSIYPNDKLAEQAQFALIQVLAERHQFDQVDLESKEFHKKYPNSPFVSDALFLQAEALFGLGQFQNALDRFRNFVVSNKNPQLLEIADFRIAACYDGLHGFDKARDGFLAFLQQHPNAKRTPDALFHLGRCYFNISQEASDSKVVQANLANAIKVYTMFPTGGLMPKVTFQLGYLYAYRAARDTDQTGKLASTADFEMAVASFQELVNRWPDNRLVPEALYQIARNQFALSKFDAAVAAYQQLVGRFPDHDLASFAAYEIADCYARENKPAEMVAALRNFVKRYPHHARVGNALYTVASQLEGEKKPDEAIAEYRNVISHAAAASSLTDNLHDAAVASELHIASILENRGNFSKTVTDCEGFLGNFKDDPVAARAMTAQIATLYRKEKKFDEAYVKLDQLVTQYRQNANVRIAAAASTIDLALSENDVERAYAAALTLLAEPETVDLPSSSYLAVGNVMLRRGQFVQARNAYQKSFARSQKDTRTAAVALVGFGESELGLNQLDYAETTFNQVLTGDPQGLSHAEAELGLAKVYLARGRDRGPKDPVNLKAVDLLNKVMAGTKGESAGEAAYLLGTHFFNFKENVKDNKKTALAYYLRVALLMSGPHGEEAAYRSGECHKVLGNIKAARSAFQAYLRRFPIGQFAADAKKELESLPSPLQES
jgi:TolA-binding protein